MDWQSIITIAIIFTTLCVFIISLSGRKKNKSSCGHSCDCGKTAKKKDHSA